MNNLSIRKTLNQFFEEDNLFKNEVYLSKLPKRDVSCRLIIKEDVLLSGTHYFGEVFATLSESFDSTLNEQFPVDFAKYEGKKLEKGQELTFTMPFDVVLSGERIALNLLQHATSISTYTAKFVQKLNGSGIKLLDTRKTTPGLRSLEKYATNIGGAFNHRFDQMDSFMIKDNHKNIFGGVEEAVNFFRGIKSFYTPLVVEIHDLNELTEAIDMGISHIMLDNFTPEQVKEAVKIKTGYQSYEVSGGITLDSIDRYIIEGVDAISVGQITYNAPHVDISLKYE